MFLKLGHGELAGGFSVLSLAVNGNAAKLAPEVGGGLPRLLPHAGAFDCPHTPRRRLDPRPALLPGRPAVGTLSGVRGHDEMAFVAGRGLSLLPFLALRLLFLLGR